MKSISSFYRTGKFFSAGAVLLLAIVFCPIAQCAVSDYVGAYIGLFQGDDEGIWIGIIEDSGDIVFITSSNINNLAIDGGILAMDENGNISGSMDISGRRIEASITIDYSGFRFLSGSYTGDEVNGTIEGFLQSQMPDYTGFQYLIGTYSGVLSGDDTGAWRITLEPSGYVFGSVYFSNAEPIDVEGGIFRDGILMAYNETGLGIIVVVEDNEVRGSWEVSGTVENGLLSGSKEDEPTTGTEVDTDTDQNSSDSDNNSNNNGSSSSGGGGGGCLITSLSF